MISNIKERGINKDENISIKVSKHPGTITSSIGIIDYTNGIRQKMKTVISLFRHVTFLQELFLYAELHQVSLCIRYTSSNIQGNCPRSCSYP